MANDPEKKDIDPLAEFAEQFADTPELAAHQRAVSFWRAKLACAMWITEARKHAKLSASELAFKLELSEQEVLDFEDINNSKAEPPTLALMYQISNICKMHLQFALLNAPPPGSLKLRWSDQAADAMRTILGSKKED